MPKLPRPIGESTPLRADSSHWMGHIETTAMLCYYLLFVRFLFTSVLYGMSQHHDGWYILFCLCLLSTRWSKTPQRVLHTDTASINMWKWNADREQCKVSIFEEEKTWFRIESFSFSANLMWNSLGWLYKRRVLFQQYVQNGEMSLFVQQVPVWQRQWELVLWQCCQICGKQQEGRCPKGGISSLKWSCWRWANLSPAKADGFSAPVKTFPQAPGKPTQPRNVAFAEIWFQSKTFLSSVPLKALSLHLIHDTTAQSATVWFWQIQLFARSKLQLFWWSP